MELKKYQKIQQLITEICESLVFQRENESYNPNDDKEYPANFKALLLLHPDLELKQYNLYLKEHRLGIISLHGVGPFEHKLTRGYNLKIDDMEFPFNQEIELSNVIKGLVINQENPILILEKVLFEIQT